MKILAVLSKKIKHNFFLYVQGLIVSPEQKTCTKIASFLGVSHDLLYRFLSKTKLLIPIFPQIMFSLAGRFARNGKGYLIVDDTALSKPFIRFLAGVYDIYNTALKRPDRGLTVVVVAWSNGVVTIPLMFDFAFHKEIVDKKYRTKSVIVQSLIEKCRQHVPFEYILGDGHYSTQHLLKFVAKSYLEYTGKIARNRVVEDESGNRYQLKNHPGLKLIRNERRKKIRAQYAGVWLFFSVHKRIKRNGDFTYVYIVSTLDLNPREYLDIYAGRWFIECMFRTMKQKLGFAECQAQNLDKQKLHLLLIFFAYGFLQSVKNDYELKNPEEAIKLLRKLKSSLSLSRIAAFSGNFQCIA